MQIKIQEVKDMNLLLMMSFLKCENNTVIFLDKVI